MNPRATALEEWLLAHRRGAMALAVLLAGFIAVCWIVIQTRGSFPLDDSLASWIQHPHPPEPLSFCASVFNELADPIVACVSVAIAWILVARCLGDRYGILVVLAVGAVAVNETLKAILGPSPLQLSMRGSLAAANFPSGHVTYATSLFGILGWFALTRGARKSFFTMVALIIAMGPCRILDGAHWPSDVLAGYALGLAWTIGVLVLGTPWALRGSAPGSRWAGECG